jgi:hypothetical protein
MNRLRPIPEAASVVEFTFKQDSYGRLVQQQTPMVRPEHRSGRSDSTLSRKRRRMGGDYEQPIPTVDDAFVYLDHHLPQYSSLVRIPFWFTVFHSTER